MNALALTPHLLTCRLQLTSVMDAALRVVVDELSSMHTSGNTYELSVMAYALTLGGQRAQPSSDVINAANDAREYLDQSAINAGTKCICT